MCGIDRAWLAEAVELDPASVSGHVRRAIDQVLDLYHWFDLYRPELHIN